MNNDKKKHFVEFPGLSRFMTSQSLEINAEYREIVLKLEIEGSLAMPFGEKLKGENLFAIRVIHAGNASSMSMARKTTFLEFMDM